MIKSLLITLSTFTLVFGGTIKITPCSSNPVEARSESCSSDPCVIKRGTTGVLDIDFVAPADSKTLTAELTAHVGSIDIPHPSFDRDVCNDHGVTCPVTKGQKYTYTYKMSVLPEYPKIRTTFKYSAKDDSGNTVFCFTFPIQLE